MKLVFATALTATVAFGAGALPARADTCQTHYQLCVNKYGNPPSVCGCARSICLKNSGKADVGPKWNWIPGIDACFRK